MSYKKWTKEEDETLLYQIRSTHTLRDAFIHTAQILNRTIPSCKQRWYTVLSKNPTSKYFILHSPNSHNKHNTWWDNLKKLLKRK